MQTTLLQPWMFLLRGYDENIAAFELILEMKIVKMQVSSLKQKDAVEYKREEFSP